MLGWKTQLLLISSISAGKPSPNTVWSKTVDPIKGVGVKPFVNALNGVWGGPTRASQLNKKPPTLLKDLSHGSLTCPKEVHRKRQVIKENFQCALGHIIKPRKSIHKADHPRGIETICNKRQRTRPSTATVYMLPKNWKQPKCLSTL